MQPTEFTRRRFLETTVAAAGATILPLGAAFAQTPTPSKAKYRRYSATSPGGKKALASYARGVTAMLKLPADHPQNWFRNAFIHILDCPHGNWWFYVWHRGYLGYFEETIRALSGDSAFALPYWDWTTAPELPSSMFDGVLTPRDVAYEPYTGDLARFTAFLKPTLNKYWNSLNPAQRGQLNLRGYTEFDLLWNDVTGFNPTLDNGVGISGNMAYAITCGARYITRENPKLDASTAYDVSPFVVYGGLLPTDFYNPEVAGGKLVLSFTSSKTASHNAPPSSAEFSVLEGLPHNLVHNFIGGVGYVDPGPYGYMTNFLSPVDPIFFLHHANLDRLWDVWTRKQKRLNLPWLPTGQDLDTFANDPFLFYVNGKGEYVGESKAGDYLNMDRFQYDYEPGFGEKVVQAPDPSLLKSRPIAPLTGSTKDNTGSVNVPAASIQKHLASATGPALLAKITLPHPDTTVSVTREFDVIVGAPADVTQVNPDSPYYAGTIAFFGNMSGMKGMPMDATFTVPLPKAPQAFAEALAAPPNNAAPPGISIRVVPSHGRRGKAPALKSVSMHAL